MSRQPRGLAGTRDYVLGKLRAGTAPGGPTVQGVDLHPGTARGIPSDGMKISPGKLRAGCRRPLRWVVRGRRFGGSLLATAGRSLPIAEVG